MSYILPSICILFIALTHMASAITLEEGMADKTKYIFYDTSSFNPGIHAGLALLITFGLGEATKAPHSHHVPLNRFPMMTNVCLSICVRECNWFICLPGKFQSHRK
ncbi:unnamed protein product [Hymenolepis diminuta]|uniref:Uncharacterized protein n=1 Tax=Hymenolepis diminuta TaxID=6216 RepID=A0A564XYM7_HYMDI|nr:unnamed protein product [Hymenolepis diminuta]